MSVFQYCCILYGASDYSSLAVHLKMASWFHTDWWISHVSPERVTNFSSITPSVVSVVCCAVVRLEPALASLHWVEEKVLQVLISYTGREDNCHLPPKYLDNKPTLSI